MNIRRVFLVGCPRSGTTLLQSMVASHPKVVSFAETHFFSKTLPINHLLRKLKLYGFNSRATITSFLNKNGYDDIDPFIGAPVFCTHNQWCQILLQTLDEMIISEARNRNSQTVWGLEKTPRHLFYISSIQKTGFHNKFLHILRYCPDVVASLYLATQSYPDQWGGARSIKKCIRWCNNSVRESLKFKKHSNHFFTTYEQLLMEPEKILKAVCKFLDINYHQSMVNNFHNTAGLLTKEKERWKQKNISKQLNNSRKLKANFDHKTINFIKENVIDIDLTQFHH